MEQEPIFSADDWGMSPSINKGILRLAQHGLLHEISMMSNMPYLKDGIDELKACLSGSLRCSLHFNLTEGLPVLPTTLCPSLIDPHSGRFWSHKSVLWRSYLRALSPDDIRQELSAQYSQLEHWSIPVTGINGHHHIHLLPGISEVILNFMKEKNLRHFRIMSDWAHPTSKISSALFIWNSKNISQKILLENLHYLVVKDFKNHNRLSAKLTNRGQKVFLIHPAQNIDETSEPWRYRQLSMLMKEFSGGH